ncbi:hypothetical protein SAMN02799637_01294 [Ralstonia sp. UNCCL144]|jgi:hypothetical protein|nr:hypothetical protein [Ralstonia insidiosa]MBA9939275.1 hypothetical protein [Ralstonia insidiosa]SCW55576.1 hypothetical protein SAMN02799637_01294 [Ralstonia sp. UNCCL144]
MMLTCMDEPNIPLGRVTYDYKLDMLIGSIKGGPIFELHDPREIAELMFAACARHGWVFMPDWREGDISPPTGDKIAFHHRMCQLANDK